MKFWEENIKLEKLIVGLVRETLRVKSLAGKALAIYQICQSFSTLKLW